MKNNNKKSQTKFLDQKLTEKFLKIEKILSDEKGSFALFTLIQREDTDLWDLIVSADWIKIKNQKETLEDISKVMKKYLDKNDLINISRIILLDPNELFVKNINRAFHIPHQTAFFENVVIGSYHIDKAIIFSSIQPEKT